MPFRFRDDLATADVAFDAWGATREAMFSAAAEALLATLVGRPGAVEPRVEAVVEAEAAELDLLLLAFLSELVFRKDAQRLLLRPESVRIEGEEGSYRVSALARGEPVDPPRHRPGTDVKAATLHRLRAAFEDGAWRATVVLDV